MEGLGKEEACPVKLPGDPPSPPQWAMPGWEPSGQPGGTQSPSPTGWTLKENVAWVSLKELYVWNGVISYAAYWAAAYLVLCPLSAFAASLRWPGPPYSSGWSIRGLIWPCRCHHALGAPLVALAWLQTQQLVCANTT